MEQSKDVENFMRDKFTKQELYLLLQQNVAGLYKEACELAYESAQQVQMAFQFERVTELGVELLPSNGWNNLEKAYRHENDWNFALKTMEKKYMGLNVREHELTRHISMMLDYPREFLHLKLFGWTTFSLEEWRFDVDYPGHYLRGIKSVALLFHASSVLMSVFIGAYLF